jgi:hypothetical protein
MLRVACSANQRRGNNQSADVVECGSSCLGLTTAYSVVSTQNSAGLTLLMVC